LIVFVNGAFGIGKTTVAARLRERVPGSAIFDPERLGYVLRRLPGWVPLEGRGTDDYQDLPLWRRGSVRGIRLVRAFRPVVIVPMAFSNPGTLQEFVSGVRRFDPAVRHFCLTAPLAVVRERLERRGPTEWMLRRAAECCAAHRSAEFSEHIATERLTAEQVAAEIEARMGIGAC
jgi:hypothetical protein